MPEPAPGEPWPLIDAKNAHNDEVIRRFGDATEPELREQVARAFYGKGCALRGLERHEDLGPGPL